MFTRNHRPTRRTRAFVAAAALHALAIGALLVRWEANQPLVIDVSGDLPPYYPPASAPKKGDGGTQAKSDAKPRSTPKPQATPELTNPDTTATPVEVAINTDLPGDGGSTPGVPTGREDSECVGEHCTGTETTDCVGLHCGQAGGFVHIPIAPKPIYQPQPSYPAVARLAGRQGAVVVEILVGIDGKVVDARLVSGDAPFDTSALAAVRKWRYEPLFVGGQAVMWKSTITLKFQLR